jgi:hypothetical protein
MVDKGWTALQLSPTLHLSRCSSLPLSSTRDLDNAPWHLLGLAAQTDPNRPDPIAEISRSHSHEVSERYDSWAGRFVLIGNDELHMDASGLLGCLYVVTEANSAIPQEIWISSSPALLAQLTRSEPWHRDIKQLAQGDMNWYPPPYSRYRSVCRLLPSQILTLSSGRVRARALLPDTPPPSSYDAILDELQERLLSALRPLTHRARTVWVPLSAGYDSRLVLALVLFAKIPVKTYTMKKVNVWNRSRTNTPVSSYVSRADMTLPSRIAREVGLEHRWIFKGRFNKDALDLFDHHTGGHTLENDRVYFSHGQWDWVQPSDLILRGQVFEVGHCHYWKRFPNGLPIGLMPSPSAIIEGFGLENHSVHAQGIRAWVSWASEASPAAIDWRDRMYIEQRIAGWLSPLEQAVDLTLAERFYVVNSTRTFGLLTAIPEEKRLSRTHHVDLIKRMAPNLLRFPFNPPDPSYRRMTFRIMSKLSRLSTGKW